MFLEHIDDRKTRMLLRKSLKGSSIETRHSVCEKFFDCEPYDASGRASTGARNRVYARESRILARQAAAQVLAATEGIGAQDITHVVYASCTGFTNPGPDYFLVSDLGLKPSVQRYVLGFMGCYSGVPALRMAAQICEADASARVLVVCLELCSLHLQFQPTYDSVLANSLFADGAAAAIVSSEPGAVRMDAFHTDIIAEGLDDMAWGIGDQGFDLVLSNRVPAILESQVGDIVRGVVDPDSVDHWAVHPGGRGILDKVETALDLPAECLADSRRVLAQYGNLAGTTILFVLRETLQRAQAGESIFAMAFGPGFTVEAGQFLVEKS